MLRCHVLNFGRDPSFLSIKSVDVSANLDPDELSADLSDDEVPDECGRPEGDIAPDTESPRFPR